MFNVLPDDCDRRSAARGGEVAGRPQHALPVTTRQRRVHLPQPPAGHAFEAVHQLRKRHFRRIVHQQMNMIVFAVHLDQIGFEVGANAGEERAHVVEDRCGEHPPAVLGHEDQMHVQLENAVSAVSDFTFLGHRPSYTWGMILRKAHVYRLYPTPEQAATLAQWVGAVRCVYNLALEQRRDWYRPGRRFNFASQCREVTALRAEFDWLRAVPAHPLQQAVLCHLAGQRRAVRAHATVQLLPHVAVKTERLKSSRIAVLSKPVGKVSSVRLPVSVPVIFYVVKAQKAFLCLAATRAFPAVVIEGCQPKPVLPVAFSIYACPACELGAIGVLAADDTHAGCSALVSDFFQISVTPPHASQASGPVWCGWVVALCADAIFLSGRTPRLVIGALFLRVLEWHAASIAVLDVKHNKTTIAKSHGAVVVEKLEVRNMVRSAAGTIEQPGRNVRAKSGLNRSILDQGWGQFAILLGYKLAERGGRLIEVPPHNTSRECAACGVVDAASRIGQRFHCVACGHEAHADINAAGNILRRADSSVLPVEASHRRAAEAGTRRRAA